MKTYKIYVLDKDILVTNGWSLYNGFTKGCIQPRSLINYLDNRNKIFYRTNYHLHDTEEISVEEIRRYLKRAAENAWLSFQAERVLENIEDIPVHFLLEEA